MRRYGLRPSFLFSLIAATLLVGACLNPIMDPPLSYVLRFDPSEPEGEDVVGSLGPDTPYEIYPAFAVVQVGARVVVPGRGTLTLDGNGFRGWSTRPSGAGITYRPRDVVSMPARDLTLYAVWTDETTFEVTYSTNSATGGTAPVDSIAYFPGEMVTVLPNSGGLVRTGFTFGGWNTTPSGDGEDRAPGSTFAMPDANVLLHAKWIPDGGAFTVTFNSPDATTPADPATIEVVPPETTVGTLPTPPTRDGLFFAGWWTEPSGGGTEFTATTTVNADITVHAFWSAVPTFTVTFESNGGTLVALQTIPYGGLVTEPEEPTRIGHTFDGWYADAGLTTLWDFATEPISEDVVLFAAWTPNTYNVVFDANGGDGVMPNQIVTFGVLEQLDQNEFTRLGFVFGGWTLLPGSAVSDYADQDDYTHGIDSDRVLYARWVATTTYTLTYDANSATGAGPAQGTFNSGDHAPISGPEDLQFSQNGILFRFAGWDTDPGGGGDRYQEFDEVQMNADTTLYAIWDVIGGVGPGGGLVFYDHGFERTDGWRYMELGNSESVNVAWGPNSAVNAATSADLGAGRRNTVVIAAWLDLLSQTGRAAQLANDLIEGAGFDDWFLPSTDELVAVYDGLVPLGLGNFGGTIYWTSTEVDAGNSVIVNIGTGVTGVSQKTFVSPRNVRAVRAFRSENRMYSVVYLQGQSTSGTLPVDPNHNEPGDTVTIATNTGNLQRPGYVFVGWNTAPDGSGITYPAGSSQTMPAGNLVLYPLFADEGPVARWEFAPGVEYQDSSGNANDFVPAAGAPTFSLLDSRNHVLFITTPDRLTAGPSESLDTITNGMSVSFWYYGAVAGQGSILSLYTTGGTRIWTIGQQVDNQLNILDSAGYVGGTAFNFAGGFLTEWNHVVVVFDTQNGWVLVYVNGGTPVERPLNTAFFGQDAILYLGNNPDPSNAGNAPINRSISGVRIFNRVLTAGEVSAIFNE